MLMGVHLVVSGRVQGVWFRAGTREQALQQGLCGWVKIKTQGYHRNIHNCHCVQCMKTHGNYAAYSAVKLKNVKYIKKKTLIYEVTVWCLHKVL